MPWPVDTPPKPKLPKPPHISLAVGRKPVVPDDGGFVPPSPAPVADEATLAEYHGPLNVLIVLLGTAQAALTVQSTAEKYHQLPPPAAPVTQDEPP